MKITKDIVNSGNNQCTQATITWGKGDKLGPNKEPVDDLLRISVTLRLDERTKAVSYKAHSYDIVAYTIGYIPKQTNTFTPYQLFQEGWKEIMKSKEGLPWYKNF